MEKLERRSRNIGALSYRNAALIALVVGIVVHVLYLIVFYYGKEAIIPHGRGAHARTQPAFDLARFSISFLYTYTLVFTLYLINFRLLRSKFNERLKITLIIVITLAATVVLCCILNYIQVNLLDFRPQGRRSGGFTKMMIRGSMIKDLFLATVVIFSSQIIYLSQRKQQIDLENKTLIAENMRTRYEALKNQVDPHFLFNTLNTLKSMIRIDPIKAEEYTQKLSQVLRYTLQNRDVTTLEGELEFTKAYCALMQLRYGESLKFEFNIADHYNHYGVIPLSVQTLVENAIKHNVITTRSPLTITITTSDNDTLSVSNPIRPKKEPVSGEGIGLANLTERYRLKWQQEIEIHSQQGCFSVTLPLIKGGSLEFEKGLIDGVN